MTIFLNQLEFWTPTLNYTNIDYQLVIELSQESDKNRKVIVPIRDGIDDHQEEVLNAHRSMLFCGGCSGRSAALSGRYTILYSVLRAFKQSLVR